ncbi:MAG: ornithine cyclodeaminase family protein, partial [Thaumarchaeota archaeon]
KVPGRTNDQEITLKSLGLAVEDLASAHHIYQKAKAEGIGTWVTSMASES